MSYKKDYFDYVTNILGVKSILLNQDTCNFLQVVPLLISVEDLINYTAAEKELLTKMIDALKIDPLLIKVVDISQAVYFQPEFTIHFCDDVASLSAMTKAKSNSRSNTVQTYSPRFLLHNIQTKKQVWNELQKAILFFKLRV